MITGSVIPIPPSYNANQKLDLDTMLRYIEFLDRCNAQTIMTTAGTTQFNLLTLEEIRLINNLCVSTFSKNVILGLPILSTQRLLDEINLLNKWSGDFSIMVIYPDRYYNDTTIIKFFDTVACSTNRNIFIHGLPLRSQNGIKDYDARLLNNIFQHINIVGMKEEPSSLEIAFNVCSQLKHKKSIIAAGGSMKRFNALYPTGKVSAFLSGIGNLYPPIEQEYYNKINDRIKSDEIIRKFETPLFNIFMEIGWHPALRYGLKHLGLGCEYNREPFPSLLSGHKESIKNVIRDTICQYTF